MVKSEEGTKLLHILKPAISIIPEIEAPLAAVNVLSFRCLSRPSRSGLALLYSSISCAAKYHSMASLKANSPTPSTG